MSSYAHDEWISPNRNPGDYGKVGFTIHHAATTDFSAIGRTFQNTATQTSAHYGVEPGHVQRYVPDGDIAWHAGNAWANRSTIGIECVNSGGEADGWPVAEETVDTLVEFMADKCRDLGIKRLAVGENLWGHRDWSATFCPGVLYPRLGEIAERVNAMLSGPRKNLVIAEHANGANQRWRRVVRYDGDELCGWRSMASGNYIDVPDGRWERGANLGTYPPTEDGDLPNGAQLFRQEWFDHGGVRACRLSHDGLSVDVSDGSFGDGTQVQLWDTNDGGYPQAFLPVCVGTPDDPYVYILVNFGSYKVLTEA